MRIEVVVFDGFDDLDAFGPYEVLCHAAQRVEGWDVALVGGHGPGEVVSAHGVRLRLDDGLGDHSPDGVVVAGGGWRGGGPGARAEVERGELPRRLAELAPRCRWTASVCTGGMLLAAAGLIEGRPATTHHSALHDLRATGAVVADGARVVDDGDLITAAGITSGLDLALRLVEREAGPDTARAVAEHMAYRRSPDVAVGPQRVGSGSPYEATIGFSRALRTGNRVLVSGTGPVWPDGSCAEDATTQARRCFEIVAEALRGAGAGLGDVVRTRMFVTDPAVAEEVGAVHGELLADARPAATMVVVAGLLDSRWKVEIEAEAEVHS